ncbi:winged helix DNA-binding domain-containing protein [Arthrobacter castelli]|uniref:winged helix DNA-binding domain-containing protein n=1 Tax=Arthrobacter castelli TaxID=271431 RepID=UPI000427E633|nr:winged helix DNA-binding domain-containing protein [Arthrobacter castelli]
MIAVDQQHARRFRLARHRLTRPEPRCALPEVAGAIGVQHSPPGSAAQSLRVRLDGLTPDDVDAALSEDRNLVQVWSLRGAPHVVGVEDAPVFTTGLIPDDEESCRSFIRGAENHLAAFGLSAAAAVDHVLDALPRVLDGLDGRGLTKDELGVALADDVASQQPSVRTGPWEDPDGLGSNTYGQSLVRFALYVAGLHGTVCFVPTDKGAARFALTRQWLGSPLPGWDHSRARAELVRRYLRCHAPSTEREFATWAGVSPAYASRSWDLLADELIEVQYGRSRAWALAADAEALHDCPEPAGARLLPPYDPYLSTRDRKSIIADPPLQRQVWRTVGNPGVILADGEVVGIWRPRKNGRRLTVRVEPFTALSSATRTAIQEEAAAMAPFRGAQTASVEI